ncbi:MAG: glycosyltransferase [Solirubrobacterales bacterium]
MASDLGGLADVVLDGETGLLVAPGDVAGLTAALRRLNDDAALRGRMGKAARARAAEFGPDRVVPRFESAYELAFAARLKRAGARRR